MKILIVGGGIAGTALAYFLQKKHEITIVEKAPTWRTIGYGIGLWRNGLEILNKMPIPKSFWNSGYPVQHARTFSSEGKVLYNMSLKIGDDKKSIAYIFERDKIHSAIHNLLKVNEIIFNTKVYEITQSENGVQTKFTNGSIEKFDLLIGADGLRSEVRSMIFGNKLQPYNWNVWVGKVPKDAQPFSGYYLMSATKELLISLPSGDDAIIGFIYKATTKAWPKPPKNRKEIIARFPVFKNKIKNTIFALENLSTMFCDKLEYVKMDQWYKNRVVLIGDARHGVSPLTGFGTSLALEDAFVLSEELNSNHELKVALSNFAARRDQRLRSVKLFTNLTENFGMVESPLTEKIRNLGLPLFPHKFANYLIKKILTVKV